MATVDVLHLIYCLVSKCKSANAKQSPPKGKVSGEDEEFHLLSHFCCGSSSSPFLLSNPPPPSRTLIPPPCFLTRWTKLQMFERFHAGAMSFLYNSFAVVETRVKIRLVSNYTKCLPYEWWGGVGGGELKKICAEKSNTLVEICGDIVTNVI